MGTSKQWVKRELDPTWRWLFNRQPTSQWRRHHEPLDATGQQVLTDLRRDGVVVLPLQRLCGPHLYPRLERAVASLAAQQRFREAAGPAAGVAGDAVKPYLVELLGERPVVTPDEPLLELLRHPQLRAVVEAYYGMRVQIRELNAWLNRPVDDVARMSQRWHRDLPEDHHIVKVFLYLRAVTPDSGALQYVRGSHRGRPLRAGGSGTWDGVNYRLADDDVARVFGDHDVVTASGPAGTLVIADTRGVHRGGHVRVGERLLVYGRYASRSAVGLRPLRAASAADLDRLSDLVLADDLAAPITADQPADRADQSAGGLVDGLAAPVEGPRDVAAPTDPGIRETA